MVTVCSAWEVSLKKVNIIIFENVFLCIREKNRSREYSKGNTRKSGYNTYRGWTQTGYLNKHYNTNQKDEDTYDDRGRDGGTNFILRIQGTGIKPNPS
jgi:hypothetical protein